MNSDPIEQLLREADRRNASDNDVRDAATLADDVMHRWRRRRAIPRSAGVSAVAALAIAGVVSVMTIQKSQPQQGQFVDNAEQIHRIDQELAQGEKLVDRLLLAEKRRDHSDLAARVRWVDDPIERAAATVVSQADRIRREPALSQSALQSYDDVIEHFPQTVSAQLARRRVAEMRKEG